MPDLVQNSLIKHSADIIFSRAEAGLSPREYGSLQPTDFGYKGVNLGDNVEIMYKILGEPMFDNEFSMGGQQVIRYTYSRDLRIFASKADKRIVEIDCKDQKYVARDGVTYGATKYKLLKTYGKGEPKMLNGHTYYVYTDPQYPNKRLCVELDSKDYYLKAWMITSLPLDVEESLVLQAREVKNKHVAFNVSNSRGIGSDVALGNGTHFHYGS